MRNVIAGVINGALGGSINDDNFYEAFQAHSFPTHGIRMPKGREGVVLLLSFILVEIIVLFFGKFLWNRVFIKLVGGVKAASSIWQILGISIMIKLFTN